MFLFEFAVFLQQQQFVLDFIWGVRVEGDLTEQPVKLYRLKRERYYVPILLLHCNDVLLCSNPITKKIIAVT